MVAVKVCRHCGEEKPLDDFYRHRAMADGHINVCRRCCCARETLRRRTNPAVQEYDRSRGLRKSCAEASKRWRAKYPTKRAAQVALGNAVRDKRIIKQPCLFCKSEKVEAHHKDYTKPLDVVWLCPTCHRRLHSTFPDTAVVKE